MKRFLKYALIFLFVLLLPLGSVTVETIVQTQSYGKLINYVGIVRGATQRLVKLELQNQPSDELIRYLDGILLELDSGEGSYDLPVPQDSAYQANLDKLITMWGQLKEQIAYYRSGMDNGKALLSLSENYYTQANATVFSADAYSAHQTKRLLIISLLLLAVMLLSWLLIFWLESQKMQRLETANKELGDLTKRDSLTGAYQFEAFKQQAQQLLAAAPEKQYALVYMDFSDFNYINDVFGNDYGDKILKRYGEILGGSLREDELLGRVSADNFIALVHYERKQEIVTRQRRCDQEIALYMSNVLNCRALETCCGICCLADIEKELKLEAIVDRANFARKTVKNGANPNYVFYNESIHRRLREEIAVESRMKEALRQHEFIVYFQPKVALTTGRIASAEALVRWQTPDGQTISPDKFIPVFERKFIIGELDQYVFEEVCRWLRQRLDAGLRVEAVSVNVSRLQFYDQDFVQRYVAIRERYQIPPQLLEVEFTESIVMDNAALLLKIVNALKQSGFACSIDDFGKGYSSLSLLKNLPVDVVKIDRFFFAESDDHQRDLAVVQGIVELVQKFQIATVAEGVESPEQAVHLRDIGCDLVQGYAFYRPMPVGDYEALLDAGK